MTTAEDLHGLFKPRPKSSNKGMYGHVLVVGGSYGKSGAPTMAGLGAYRVGAGLVTVAIPKSALLAVAAARPELMTEPLEETPSGRVAGSNSEGLLKLLGRMTLLAVGPGLGTDPETATLVRRLYQECPVPAVLDADALNILAGSLPPAASGQVRVLTPHPGEMARLAGISTKEVQGDRLGVAQRFAAEHNVTVVLKGDRTVIAFPEGETWINPTGSPALAKGGTGDVLTGMVSGLMAQQLTPELGSNRKASQAGNGLGSNRKSWQCALLAAVWLHGRSGELAGERLGEQSTLALDLLDDLPRAIAPLRAL
jgi:NAD(P)H-hydrate epimerase